MNNASALKKEILDLIGIENIKKSRISKDKKGLWVYNKNIKSMPHFIHFEELDFLKTDKDFREILIKDLSRKF